MLQPLCTTSSRGVFNKQAFEFISFKITPQNLSLFLVMFDLLGFLDKGFLKEKLTIDGGTLGGYIYSRKMLGFLAFTKSFSIDDF